MGWTSVFHISFVAFSTLHCICLHVLFLAALLPRLRRGGDTCRTGKADHGVMSLLFLLLLLLLRMLQHRLLDVIGLPCLAPSHHAICTDALTAGHQASACPSGGERLCYNCGQGGEYLLWSSHVNISEGRSFRSSSSVSLSHTQDTSLQLALHQPRPRLATVVVKKVT